MWRNRWTRGVGHEDQHGISVCNGRKRADFSYDLSSSSVTSVTWRPMSRLVMVCGGGGREEAKQGGRQNARKKRTPRLGGRENETKGELFVKYTLSQVRTNRSGKQKVKSVD